MQFPCIKCTDYTKCNECKLIIEYEIRKKRQEEKRYKNKMLQRGKRNNVREDIDI